MRLLVSHGAAVGRRTSATEVVELGCGNGQKLEALVRSMEPHRPDIYLIDVSQEALDRPARCCTTQVCGDITAVQATYEDGLMQLPPPPPQGRRLILFLGSNIGNFDPPGRVGILRSRSRA